MKNIIIKSVAVLAAGFFLGACEKNAIEEHYSAVNSGAKIKMIHAAQEAPMVNMYLDNNKITALAPTAAGIVAGLSYGATAVFPASYGYSNVQSGTYNLQVIDTMSAKGSADVITAQSVTLNDNASYSTFLIGKRGAFEAFVVQDELPAMNNNKTYIRFVNVMVDAPVNFDAKAVRRATADNPEVVTVIGSNISYKGSTAYVEIDPGTYDFPIYEAGSATPYTTMTGVAPIGGRVYTLYTRGNHTAAPAAANRVLVRDR